jgi:hypothetical protein
MQFCNMQAALLFSVKALALQLSQSENAQKAISFACVATLTFLSVLPRAESKPH